MTEYKPGDVANGYVLGEDMAWRPVDATSAPKAPPPPSDPSHRTPAKSRGVVLAIVGVALATLLFVSRSVWNGTPAVNWLIPLALAAAGWWLALKGKRVSLLLSIASLAVIAVLAVQVFAPSFSGLLDGPDYDELAAMKAGEFKSLTPQEWSAIEKNPTGSSGKKVILFAEITQFDQATGEETFRANASALQPVEEYEYDSNTIFRGDPKILDELKVDDVVRVQGVVAGAAQYTNTMGGGNDAVQVDVARIQKVGLGDLRTDVKILGRVPEDEYYSKVELEVTNSASERKEYYVEIAAKSADGNKHLGEATASTGKIDPGETVKVDATSLDDEEVPKNAKLIVDEVSRS